MHAPAFWWRERMSLPAHLLAPAGAIAGMVATWRLGRPGTHIDAPVICIGNPVAGGAGKTPTALAIAERLIALGQRPAFVTRGYGGTMRGPERVDILRHGHEATGDEPLLLARRAATYVARNRVEGAQQATLDGASVIVLDDGFQNPALEKDLSLLVIDGMVGTGNGFCLPAGPLRAPLGPQLARCGGVIVVGEGLAGQRVAGVARARGTPVFGARIVPDAEVAARLSGRKVVAFAGIGRPSKFSDTLLALGAKIVAFHAVGDHAMPGEALVVEMLAQAARADALVVTTEKDAVKIPAGTPLAEAALAIPVHMVFDEPERVDALLRNALSRVSDRAGRSAASPLRD